MENTRKRARNPKGFTLVELLIAVAISGIAMTAIYSTYRSQQKTYIIETQVAAMQQNLRAAMFYIERELRMAGCDPTGNAGAGIVTAGDSTIRFTMDITGGENDGKDNDNDGTTDESGEDVFADGDTLDTNEDITYALADNDGDGDMDLERNNNLIAENIDVLNLVYLDANSTVLDMSVDSPSDIRSIQVTVVARTGQGDVDYSNSTSYTNRQGTEILAPQNDKNRRTVLTTTIKCRNLGL